MTLKNVAEGRFTAYLYQETKHPEILLYPQTRVANTSQLTSELLETKTFDIRTFKGAEL